MKIITWNVNGLRAVWKKGEFQNLTKKYQPDILGIQETKSSIEQLHDDTKNHDGYFSYFESATMRKGYSGVAIYSKEEPLDVKATLGDKNFLDDEGRTIIAEYEDFYLINCYWPNGGKSPEHFQYKLEYYDKFLKLAKKLEKKKPKTAISAVASIRIFRRPNRSATTAETGIQIAKNNTENNWINNASLFTKPKSEVAQLKVKTVIR